MLPLLARRVGVRRVRATADVCVEWPERRRGAARRKTRGRRGQGSRGIAVVAADAVAQGRYWEGRGVMPLACHGGAGRGRASADVRIEWLDRGEGASLVVRRMSVGVRAWGSVPPLPPASSPCARAGLRAHGSSPRGARDADAMSDRVALSGAACVGWVPRVARGDAGRADRSGTGGCRAAPLAERRGDVRVRARGAALSPPPALSRGNAIGEGGYRVGHRQAA